MVLIVFSLEALFILIVILRSTTTSSVNSPALAGSIFFEDLSPLSGLRLITHPLNLVISILSFFHVYRLCGHLSFAYGRFAAIKDIRQLSNSMKMNSVVKLTYKSLNCTPFVSLFFPLTDISFTQICPLILQNPHQTFEPGLRIISPI